jgi:hypothetical protein
LTCSYRLLSSAFLRRRSRKAKFSLNLHTTGGVDVDVNVLIQGSEHAVLVPIGLSYSQDITRRF